jgi:hypothetical protein
MSSRYTMMFTSSRSEKMLFMKRWKAAGALERPKGMTRHLNEL